MPGTRPIAKAWTRHLQGENPGGRNRPLGHSAQDRGECDGATDTAARRGQPGSVGHGRRRRLHYACRLRQPGDGRPVCLDGRSGRGTTRGGKALAGVALCRDIPELTSVVVTHTKGFRPQKGSILPRGITIAEPRLVRILAAALCGLPKMPPGLMTCAAGFGGSLRFGFAAGGRPFPPVTVQASSCRVVTGLGPARTARSTAFWRTLSEDLGLSSPRRTSRSGGIKP